MIFTKQQIRQGKPICANIFIRRDIPFVRHYDMLYKIEYRFFQLSILIVLILIRYINFVYNFSLYRLKLFSISIYFRYVCSAIQLRETPSTQCIKLCSLTFSISRWPYNYMFSRDDVFTFQLV